MDTLLDRREVLTARFFKRQVLASSSLLHYLLPDRRDNDTILSLKNPRPLHKHRARTKKLQKSFIPYCLDNYTQSLNSNDTAVVFLCFVFHAYFVFVHCVQENETKMFTVISPVKVGAILVKFGV